MLSEGRALQATRGVILQARVCHCFTDSGTNQLRDTHNCRSEFLGSSHIAGLSKHTRDDRLGKSVIGSSKIGQSERLTHVELARITFCAIIIPY
jgi:hypothetical protein